MERPVGGPAARLAGDGSGHVLRHEPDRYRADGSMLSGPTPERWGQAAPAGMRAVMDGAVRAADAGNPADSARGGVRPGADFGQRRDDRAGEAVSGFRPSGCAAAASVLAHDGVGATESLVWGGVAAAAADSGRDGPQHRRLSRSLRSLDIGLGEVVTFVEKWHVGVARTCIGRAVAKIECGGMTRPTVASICLDREASVSAATGTTSISVRCRKASTASCASRGSSPSIRATAIAVPHAER
jgi:hypothetical protein